MNQLKINNRVREVQLQVLKGLLEVKRICEKHKITYYLVGGSALGAIRHRGFIPWDDDVDVAMPRVEYERFLDICKTELGVEFFLQTRETDPEYFFQFAKIRINNTKYVQKSVENVNIHQGIYVDIFPLDKISTNRIIAWKQKILVESFIKFRSAKIHNHDTKPFEYIIKKIVGSFFTFKQIHKVISYNIQLANYSNSKKIGNLVGNYGFNKEVFVEEVFGKPYITNFEEHDFPIPEKYDYFLTQIYGDYMQLPPLEKRTNHNPILIEIDGNKI